MGPNQNNDVQQDELDREEEALRKEAEEIDPKRPEDDLIKDDTTASHAGGDGKPDPKKQERTASDKSAAAGTEKPDPSKDKAKGAEAKPGADTAATDKTKPDAAKTGGKDDDESKLTPYQRDLRRLARNRQEFEDEKKREREALQRERAAIEAEKRSLREKPAAKPAQDPNTPTADSYDKIAADYEAEGNLVMAKRARETAAQLREQQKAAAAEAGAAKPAQDLEAQQQEWTANLERLGEQYPELKQEDSPLRSHVAKLLKEEPLFHTVGGKGIVFAVEGARLMAEVQTHKARVAELEAQVTELEKKNQELTELTSIPAGGATVRAEARKIEDMSLDEQENALREEAAAHDGG